ncbi:hypothetical protein BDV37DRAFT_267829 [Aspergillus pseudonomiae]|uniref:F-box domain-containing protein n=1 Tax=Aspergillus pseudonomiae TaxID=1506151 RepID=A0A5N7DUG4_9EURO|nr:uncharacterized protein BDV37DRAFT_267829 [Aspergillus pseudonomiae]KAE8409663.1 hypothetical protein BDV37DRAFT_267829 [Aspergillus pseudonomiae]
MASGTAYRCKRPPYDVLQFYLSSDSYKLYKAPPNKPLNSSARATPFIYQLPVEILHSILLNLDLRSIPMLCRFCHPWSRTCPGFDPLLYLPTFTRSCYKRSYLRPEYELARVADIRSLPVIYNIEPLRCRLADITQPKALGIQIHGQSYQCRVQQWKRKQRQGIHAGRPRPRSAPTSLVVDEGVSWRMQATVAFPYWDYRTQTLEPGTYCTYHWEEGKADDWRRMETIWDLHSPSREAYYRAFLEADIPQYFLYCPAAGYERNI